MMKTTTPIVRPKLSFMSANFLGREKGYQNVIGFGEEGTSLADTFSPAATYSERIGRMFEEVALMGFGAIDLWTAHCHPQWATEQHFSGVRAAVEKHGVQIASVAGGMGNNISEFEGICRVAQAIGAPVLGVCGNLLSDHRDEMNRLLDRYQVKLGFENHPNEKTPSDVLEKIEYGKHPRIGVTLDTGWFGTFEYPVVDAVEELKEHLLLVHLKNIEAPGAHDAATWDEGCLDIKPIVEKLINVGYTGYISLEYEPFDRDPSASCAAFRAKAEEWISELVPAGV